MIVYRCDMYGQIHENIREMTSVTVDNMTGHIQYVRNVETNCLKS